MQPNNQGFSQGIPQQQQPTVQPIADPNTAPQPANAAIFNDPKNKDRKEEKKSLPSTQNSLLISEIRESMVIMQDGSFRAVIACKSINFDLMSSREREAVEYSYQNFLNALYFPTQIFIRSQRVDIGPYLDRLEEIRRSQDNMLLNVLTDDYINFIDVLAQEANIMDKSFFIAVPFYPITDLNKVADQGKSFFKAFKPASANSASKTKIDQETYNKAKDEIKNRVDSVMSGLFQIGIKCVQLNTKELGELYYNMYNPDTAVREPLGDFERITSTYVRRGQGEAPARPIETGGNI